MAANTVLGCNQKKILSVLENTSSEGIQTSDFLKSTKLSRPALYSVIYHLKKKGHDIINKNGIYYYEGKKSENKHGLKNESNLDPNINELSKLSNGALNDYLEQYKMAVYYQLTSEALLEATRRTELLKQKVAKKGYIL